MNYHPRFRRQFRYSPKLKYNQNNYQKPSKDSNRNLTVKKIEIPAQPYPSQNTMTQTPPNQTQSPPKQETISLSGVYDRNGNPISNAFIKVPVNSNGSIDASTLANAAQISGNSAAKGKRGLMLGGLMGAVSGGLGSMTGGANQLLGAEEGSAAGGIALGVGAAGAGMAARKGRQQEHYMEVTKITLRMNFYGFQKELTDTEITELQHINRTSARLNGLLNSLEKNLIYRVNNRILEMMDALE